MDTINLNQNKAIRLLGVLLSLVLIFKVAWVAEDAYIAFRAIDNFLNGYGFVFNKSERVQVFTDPLFNLFLIPLVFITGEYFYTTIFLSLLITGFTFYFIAFRITKNPILGALLVTTAALSISFAEYSTSGLENVLTHLMIVLSIFFFFKDFEKPEKKIFVFTLIASLSMLNRLDTMIFYFPAWLFLVTQYFKNKGHWLKLFKVLLLASLPLVLWELFSLVYYGFLLPNTAYAKLNLYIPKPILLKMGRVYLLNSWVRDPLIPLLLLSVVGFLVFKPFRRGKEWLFIAGVTL